MNKTRLLAESRFFYTLFTRDAEIKYHRSIVVPVVTIGKITPEVSVFEVLRKKEVAA